MTEELELTDLLIDARLLGRLRQFAAQHGTTVDALLIQSITVLLDAPEANLDDSPHARRRGRAKV
jgi:hypothetical protein